MFGSIPAIPPANLWLTTQDPVTGEWVYVYRSLAAIRERRRAEEVHGIPPEQSHAVVPAPQAVYDPRRMPLRRSWWERFRRPALRRFRGLGDMPGMERRNPYEAGEEFGALAPTADAATVSKLAYIPAGVAVLAGLWMATHD
jgi:hypothetical protein